MTSSTAYDKNNIFAKIVRGEIPAQKLFENEHVMAFQDIAAKAPIHLLVIPKGKYKTAGEFAGNASDAEILAFNRGLAEVIRQAGLTEGGYRLISNNGGDGGQEVPHFHMHVLGGAFLGHMLPELG